MFETTESFKCIFCEIEKTKRKNELTYNDYKITRDYSTRKVYEQKKLHEIWLYVYCEVQKFIRFIASTNYRINLDQVNIFLYVPNKI